MKNEYLTTSELIVLAKTVYNITVPNSEMTDEEIRKVVRLIGLCFGDVIWTDGDPTFTKTAIELMLFITICEFPEFYCRYELSRPN